MIIWISLVVFSQLLFAISSLIDKYLVTSKKVSAPIVYAFFVCLLSVLALAVFLLGFIPVDWGSLSLPNIQNVYCPSWFLVVVGFVSQFAFFGALTFLYKSLVKSDASDVVPVVGSVNALVTFIISLILGFGFLSFNLFVGFLFLVLGTALVSRFRFKLKTFLYTFYAGALFAIYYSLLKILFDTYQFDQTFFWTRISLLAVCVSIILIPKFRHKIFSGSKQTGVSGGIWVVANSILGGLAGIILLKAVELGNVALSQALTGLQFFFLIIFSIFLGHKTPHTVGENDIDFKVTFQKTISVLMIILGFVILFF